MNERLRRRIGLGETYAISSRELAEQTTNTFDSLVDFLRDKDRFPNPKINQLVTLLWRLVGNRHIPVTLDLGGRIPSLSFVVQGNLVEQAPFFILPQSFTGLVHANPAMQLGAVAFAASQARDYWTGKLIEEKRLGREDDCLKRAYAFEAEVLLTLQKLAQDDGDTLKFNAYQTEVLNRFPLGLGSLDLTLRYPTPTYTPPKRES